MKTLFGQRVVLYPFTQKDFEYFFEVYGQEDNKKLYGYNNIGSIGDIAYEFLERQAEGDMITWIGNTNNGRATKKIGVIFVEFPDRHIARVNGAVDKLFVRGLAKRIKDKKQMTYTEEALHIVTKYCFDEVNVERVEAQMVVENRLANALIRKVGFKREGTQRKLAKIDNSFFDVNLYSMIREDYDNGNGTI